MGCKRSGSRAAAAEANNAVTHALLLRDGSTKYGVQATPGMQQTPPRRQEQTEKLKQIVRMGDWLASRHFDFCKK
jgi:hypothetical protein